jgi:prolyl-tRNA editing enzyme YbaK/EbsC (Cys-tRNA(Pro) deacylase)
MANFYHIESDTASGMAGGTLLAVIVQLDSSDIVRTLILASVGAVASFIMSHFCRWCLKKIKARFKKTDV